jgi:sugar phosphate isomerase/epimerase
MKPALQLWTVREELIADPEACIQKIARLGIEEVEGFDLIQLMSIFPILKDNGIECRSSFLFWPHITGNTHVAQKIRYPWLPHYWGIHHEIELATRMNLDTLVMGYWDESERSTLSNYHDLSDRLNLAGRSCRQAGKRLLYHHHAFEFQKKANEIPFDVLVQRTDSDLVGFELDTYWLEVAGQIVQEKLNSLAGKTKQLHLKNGRVPIKPCFNESLFSKQSFRSLPRGDLDIADIVKLAQMVGVERFFY